MIPVDYSGNVINWTDGEYERLEAIKQKKMSGDMWGHGGELVGARITPLLKQRTMEYAKDHGVNVSELLRQMLKIIVD